MSIFRDDTKLKGTVEVKLFNKNWKEKKTFKENFLWKCIMGVTGFDIRIPYITGVNTYSATRHNLIVTKGKEITAKQLGGTTTDPVTAIALGIGITAANAADTALESEITTAGGQRGAATVTNVTVTTANDTEQWTKTFTFTGTFAVTEEGLLDNNTSGGNLLARNVFAAINVVSGDAVIITHKVQMT